MNIAGDADLEERGLSEVAEEVADIQMDIVPDEGDPQGGIRTDCRRCIFETMEGPRQVGCKLGRIARFEEQGSPVESWSDDEGEVHFQIPGRFCNTVRSPEWLEAQPDKSPRALRRAIRDVNRATVTAVVHVAPGREPRKVYKTLDSLKRHSKYVRHVVVVVEDDPRLKSRIGHWLAKNSAFTWESVDLKPTSAEGLAEYEHAPWLRAVDEAMTHPRTMFYTAARAGYQWPDGVFDRLDSFLNVDFGRILAVGPERGEDGFVAYVAFHCGPGVGGNVGDPIHRKVAWAAQDHGHAWYYADHKDFFGGSR